MNRYRTYTIAALLLAGCYPKGDTSDMSVRMTVDSSVVADSILKTSDTLIPDDTTGFRIITGYTKPQELVTFAQTLKGIPYEYASCTKEEGFDCSGFVYYVFSHFNIDVPRSSSDYTHVGKEVPVGQAKPGDLILFTGTNPADRTVGHMGIITVNTPDSLLFIHSSSGQANGVTTSPLEENYKKRFVKVIRVFAENDRP